MAPVSERSRPYDVGVLLVHGIGEQQKGETLLEAGHAIVDVLRKRLAWLVPAAGAGATPAVPQADLELIQLHRDDASQSAEAEIRLSNIGHLRPANYPFSPHSTSRWLIAESWWAESFPPPSYSNVFLWVVKILPGAIVTHFDRRLRRTLFEISNPDNLQAPGLKYLRLVRDLVSLVVAAVVVFPVLCTVTVALLVGFLPIPFAETIARSIQRVLAAIVGDSYALLGNPLLGSAIVDTVRQHIRRLGDRCQRVMVIAHSQGGAIAHAAVRKDPLVDCEVLITYGSGLHKLTLVEQLSHGRTSMLWLAVFSLFLASSIFLTLLISWTWLGIWVLAGAGFLLGGCAALALWFHSGGREFSRERQSDLDRMLFEQKFELTNDRVEWSDVYASDDPVPNGPLLDEYSPPYHRLRTHVTRNLGSMLFDHTSYWQNHDDFVSRVTRMILFRAFIDVGRFDADDHDRQVVATDRRRWRATWRRLAGWAAGIAALSVSRRLWTNPPALATRVYEWVADAVREFPLVGRWLASSNATAFHSPVGVLLFIVLFVALSWSLYVQWRAWTRQEVDDFFNRIPYRFMTAPMRMYAGALAVVLLFGTSVLFGFAPFYVAAAVSALVAITLTTDRVGWTRLWDGVRLRSAIGTLQEIRTRWRSHQAQWLDRQSQRRRPAAVFELGLKQIESQSTAAQGVVTLQRAIDMNVRNACWWLGQHLEKNGRFPDAQKAYESGRDLGDPMAAYQLGRLLANKMKQPAAAIAAYRHAAVTMRYPPACHSLGLLLEDLKRHREARRAYKLGTELNDALSLSWLGDLYASAARRRDTRGTWSARFHREAARLYTHAARQGEAAAAMRLGTLLAESNDIAGALDAFGAGTRLRNDGCAVSMGRLLLREGRHTDAEEAFRLGIELNQLAILQQDQRDNSPSIEAAWELGRILEDRGATASAQRLYLFAAGTPGTPRGSAAAAIRITELETAAGRAEESERMWRRAVELQSATGALGYSRWLHSQGRWRESLFAAGQARGFLEIDPAVTWRQQPSLMVAIGDQLRAAHAFFFAAEIFQLAAGRGSSEGAARLVELIVQRGDIARARDLAADLWRVESTSTRVTLARFLLLENEPGPARHVMEQTPARTAEESLMAARMWEALKDRTRALDAYEHAMNEGVIDAVDPFIACLGDRDPERLARVLQFAVTLGYRPTTTS